MTRQQIDLFLGGRQQIEQQRCHVTRAQLLGNELVAQRVTTTATAMCEHHQPVRTGWNGEVTLELHAAGIDDDVALSDFREMSLRRHYLSPLRLGASASVRSGLLSAPLSWLRQSADADLAVSPSTVPD